MLKKKMDKRCLDIINHYGPDYQKRIFSGEADELRDAITEVELRDQDYLCERHEDMLIDDLVDVVAEKQAQLDQVTMERNRLYSVNDSIRQTYEDAIPKQQYIDDIEYLESVIRELRESCQNDTYNNN